MDGLRGVHTYQSDPFATVQDEGVSVNHTGDGAGFEVGR